MLPEPFATMDAIAQTGCLVILGRGPFGWNCGIQDPNLNGGCNVSQKQTPAEAVNAAAARWEVKKKEQLVGIG